MIDRRRLLASAGAGLVAAAVPRAVHAAAAGRLRLASVKYGSLSWVIETIRALELDKKAGLRSISSKSRPTRAGPVALLAGGADVIVSDWTWAMRQRSLGEKLKFSAYSSALGGLVVPENSPIAGVGDLDGKTLGVAGSAIDKSWLLLRAYSKKTIGQDMANYARPQFGAAPLLAEQIRSGRLDAVLNFWTHAARLTGSGFKEILSIESVMKDLGIDPVPALVGFVWKEPFEATHGPQIEALLNVVREANAVLATDDSAWDRLRPIVKPNSDGEFRSPSWPPTAPAFPSHGARPRSRPRAS